MDARVEITIRTMCQSIADHLSTAALARSVNLSPARLRQLFKEETGQSPLQYLKNIRMREAEQLLRSTFLSVKEITFHSGLRDVSNFA
jgi:transcriptional regulator GlxA family with amidase domain